MKKALLILVTLFLSSFQAADFTSLCFLSTKKKQIDFSRFKERDAVVFLYLMPDCPFCIKYAKTIRDLYKEHSASVSFIGVIPGDLYTEKEVADYIKNHNLEFPFIIDSKKKLTSMFKVTVSPSCVVSTGSGKILYKGMLDNWPVAPGKSRQVITEHYLRDVLTQVKQKKPVTVRNTEALGCIIE